MQVYTFNMFEHCSKKTNTYMLTMYNVECDV